MSDREAIAIEAALDGAVVERVDDELAARFDPQKLATVVALFKAPGGEDRVKAAWRYALYEDAIKARADMERAQACLVLRDRLIGSRDREYLSTSDGLVRRQVSGHLPDDDAPLW